VFEWDTQKRIENVQAHGVDFVRAARMFANPVLEVQDARSFGEKRFFALGHVAGFFMVVTWTPRGRRRRLLAAWRADREDEVIYRTAIPVTARQAAGRNPGRRALPGQSRGGVLEGGHASLPDPGSKAGKGPSRS
jgi:uncharacterized DUF497 family protein